MRGVIAAGIAFDAQILLEDPAMQSLLSVLGVVFPSTTYEGVDTAIIEALKSLLSSQQSKVRSRS